MSSDVSIVIPHYGDAAPTTALIDQLERQIYGGQVQLIVSDDASPYPFEDARCVVVRRSTNGGFGSAVNSGVERAEHDLLLILNSDISIGQDFVAELVHGAHDWMPAVVSTAVEEPWGKRCVGRSWPTSGHVALEMLAPFARFHGRMWFEELLGNDVKSWNVDVPVPTDWATGVCLLMPTAAFCAAGGFDESYFMNCEEVDLQRRLHSEQGLPTVILPTPVIQHAGGGSSDPQRRSQWLLDARFRYHEKWRGGPSLLVATMAAVTTNLFWNSARSALGRDVQALPRWKSQVHAIRHAWRHRR